MAKHKSKISDRVKSAIRARRKLLGLSQHAVAERIGRTQPTYFAIESRASAIGLDTLEEVATALETTVLALIKDAEKK